MKCYKEFCKVEPTTKIVLTPMTTYTPKTIGYTCESHSNRNCSVKFKFEGDGPVRKKEIHDKKP